jgi:hypothetical protein
MAKIWHYQKNGKNMTGHRGIKNMARAIFIWYNGSQVEMSPVGYILRRALLSSITNYILIKFPEIVQAGQS